VTRLREVDEEIPFAFSDWIGWLRVYALYITARGEKWT
jgi:hypothetical protein